MSVEHRDVIIIGAGLSGIGAACHLTRNTPNKSYAILESREAMGGTWDLFRYPGGLFSFELADGVDLWDFMNRFQVIVKSSNLGDNRTLAIPVAHTIYFEMGPERRASMGIDESLIRISVGIEDGEDLIADLQQAFAGLGA